MTSMRVSAIQLVVDEDHAAALLRAERLIEKAATDGAHLIVLPERFAQWAPDHAMSRAAETLPDPLAQWLAARARARGVYLVGGSILERDAGHTLPFNTSICFGPNGLELGRYRKIHLFDALVDGVVHGESSTISAGRDPVVVETPFGNVGLSVCYDVRFPELYRALADRGARIVTIPAGFTRVTGQAHWEVLVRARAIENQCFIIAAGMAGRSSPGRDFHGHTMIVDPWGVVLAEQASGDGVVTADLDLEAIDDVRSRLPALRNRRLRDGVIAAT